MLLSRRTSDIEVLGTDVYLKLPDGESRVSKREGYFRQTPETFIQNVQHTRNFVKSSNIQHKKGKIYHTIKHYNFAT